MTLAGDEAIAAFLRGAGEGGGWAEAGRGWLAQDASTRRYARLSREDGATAMLMVAPPVEAPPCPPGASDAARREMGWNAMTRLAASRVEAFAAIGAWLTEAGFSAPKLLAVDKEQGLALLEDFGEGRELARRIERETLDETAAYARAGSVLAAIHAAPVPDVLRGPAGPWAVQRFDRLAMEASLSMFPDWAHRALPGARMEAGDAARWNGVRDALVEQADGLERGFMLRDYHAENLLWLDEREGDGDGDRVVGLLDFQDAVTGWDAWDLGLLVHDARRAVSPEARAAALRSYLERSGKAEAPLRERLAVVGALNALRIIGLFARLMERDGKMRYSAFMRPQMDHLAGFLAHPSLRELRAFIADTHPTILQGEAR